MKVRNMHGAALSVPGAGELAPGGIGEANGDHHVVKAWLAAGMLATEGAPSAVSDAAEPVKQVEAEAPARKRRGG